MLTGLTSATQNSEAIHPLLLETGMVEALDYACLHNFSIMGKSTAGEAAGTLVALVGRNEGGHTLSRATVSAVMATLHDNFNTVELNTFPTRFPPSYTADTHLYGYLFI